MAEVTAVGQRVGVVRRGVRALDKTQRTLLQFARLKPLGAFGGTIIFIMLLLAFFPYAVDKYDPLVVAGAPYTVPPDPDFWFGTDSLGRDVYSRTIWGTRISIEIGVSGVFLGMTTALVIAAVTSYYGGLWDLIAQRFVDTFMALPGLVLAIFVLTMFRATVFTIILVLAFLFMPTSIRVIRSAVLSVKQQPYVESAKAIGCSTPRILIKYVIPQVLALYMISVSLIIGSAIILETSLSFLGLGLGADVPSWGNLVNRGVEDIFLAPGWQPAPPGVMIALAVIGFNLLGDALRDVFDPRLRGSGVSLRRSASQSLQR